MLDDLLAARAAIAICERLLDNPDDPDALDAARQLIDDNMPWVKLGRQLVGFSTRLTRGIALDLRKLSGHIGVSRFSQPSSMPGCAYGPSKQR